MRRTALLVALVVLAVGSAGLVGPAITFDGATCVYDGPSEVELGSTFIVFLRNDSDANAAIGLWKVRDGTTLDSFAGQVTREEAVFYRRTRDEGKIELAADLDEVGSWVVACDVEPFEATSNTPAGLRPAVILQVAAP